MARHCADTSLFVRYSQPVFGFYADYVRQVENALTKEDGIMLEACLSVDPYAIPGGQSLLEAQMSDVRGCMCAA